MNLSITILNEKPKKLYGCLRIKAEINIDGHTEILYPPVDYWSIDDYKKQWMEGLERLKTHYKSCLVVVIHNPADERFIEWWPLYRVGGKVYIRNQLIFGDIYEEQIGNKKFTPTNCYDFVGPRRRKKVSEWVVNYP